ncbi:TIGR03809 family protein [Bradyrhizobium lablabi]|uniref:TIGR03809 family protein n=1 Tax=Bradyrhizobium lablabi TaxID=722472 RepID=UPI001BA8F005|nr:TIGR03809 family protein [Bradyrhizobium lablabi]MBR1122076.1 TIGR03809 family protein [Bradyrhizobium lablabi]
MTQRTDPARGRDIVARWCVLAEQRLEYLTELFETGRWRRFHSETAFLENIREAKAAVETWQALLTREASLDNSPIDISWLGRSGVMLPPRREPARAEARGFEPPPAEIPAPLHVAPIAAEPEPVLADEVPVAPEQDALAKTVALTLDIVAMQERYPLLRNAL